MIRTSDLLIANQMPTPQPKQIKSLHDPATTVLPGMIPENATYTQPTSSFFSTWSSRLVRVSIVGSFITPHRGKNYAKGSSLLPSSENLSTKLWGRVASPRKEDPTMSGIMEKHDVTQKKTI